MKTEHAPGSGGKDKGCRWSCSALDGTTRWPRGCWRSRKVPAACRTGPRSARSACVCGARILFGSSLGSPHLRSRGHTCGSPNRCRCTCSTCSQYLPCLMRCGWVKGLGWPRYRGGTVLGFKPPSFTETFRYRHQKRPADRNTTNTLKLAINYVSPAVSGVHSAEPHSIVTVYVGW